MELLLLNSTLYDPAIPARTEIIELYRNFFSSFGHKIIWINPSNIKKIKRVKYNEVDIYLVSYHIHKSFVKKVLNLIVHSYKKCYF